MSMSMELLFFNIHNNKFVGCMTVSILMEVRHNIDHCIPVFRQVSISRSVTSFKTPNSFFKVSLLSFAQWCRVSPIRVYLYCYKEKKLIININNNIKYHN